MKTISLVRPSFYAEKGDFKSKVDNSWRTESYQKDNVAVIKVDGVLSCDCWFMDNNPNSLKNLLDIANNDENVGSILLQINSPGGEVKGVYALAQAIYNSPKKIVAFYEEACSGALWVGSQASVVYAGDDIEQTIGSVGVYIRHLDRSQQLKIEGLKVTEIVSEESPFKNFGSPYQPLTEEAKNVMQNYANQIYDAFKTALQKGRGTKLKNEALNGQVFTPKQAKEYGLIDKIGTFEDAFTKAKEYANIFVPKTNTTTTYHFTSNIKKSMEKKPFSILGSFFGFLKTNAEKSELSPEEQTEAVENALKESAKNFEELEKTKAQNQSLSIELEALKKDLEKFKAETQSLKIENERLGKMPADNPTQIFPNNDFSTNTKQEKNSWELAEHNKILYETRAKRKN